MTHKKLFEIGGYIAAAILIALGIGSIAMSVNGRNEVRADVKREYIVGTPDMNKDAIAKEAKQANLPAEVLDQLPTCNVAGKTIDNGERAKCFASYMRIHTFEATGGKTYSQMGRYLTPGGKDTNDVSLAAMDPKTGQPVENSARNLWVTETALSNALNTSFFAEQVAMFGIVVGFAFLLAGIGFALLAYTAFRWLPARQEKELAAKAPAGVPQTV